ncbi:MAG: DNA alkylation repair protein [Lachnospiraceae bacterium]|nr:DNA alkylation repair protein [Lachnospiraceae bacterium]
MTSIQEWLFERQDMTYRDFQGRLIPTVLPDRIIGVRTPELRALAKLIIKEGKTEPRKADESQAFLRTLPHFYFEENQLHAFLIAEEKDFTACMAELELFLPYVDNWATCDQLLPKAFKGNRDSLIPYINRWLTASHEYTVRFGIGVLMRYFLDDAFDERYADWVVSVSSDGAYYINMMKAWYFATALAKQYDRILPYIEGKRLDPWTHNKTIQKTVESDRILPEQKEYLKTLRIKGKAAEENRQEKGS